MPPDFEDEVAMLNAVKDKRMYRDVLGRVKIDGFDVTQSPTFIGLKRRHLIDVLGGDRPSLTERGESELARMESR